MGNPPVYLTTRFAMWKGQLRSARLLHLLFPSCTIESTGEKNHPFAHHLTSPEDSKGPHKPSDGDLGQ